MTDPDLTDLTALAGDAARLVAAARAGVFREVIERSSGDTFFKLLVCGSWVRVRQDHLLDGAPAALLYDALLDWCAERKLAPHVHHDRREWNVYLVGLANAPDERLSTHPTKLGALLLALHRAGVVG